MSWGVSRYWQVGWSFPFLATISPQRCVRYPYIALCTDRGYEGTRVESPKTGTLSRAGIWQPLPHPSCLRHASKGEAKLVSNIHGKTESVQDEIFRYIHVSYVCILFLYFLVIPRWMEAFVSSREGERMIDRGQELRGNCTGHPPQISVAQYRTPLSRCSQKLPSSAVPHYYFYPSMTNQIGRKAAINICIWKKTQKGH